jgi:Ca2+-binding RTX toxin-like protein
LRVLSRAVILAAAIACLGTSTALATTVGYSGDGSTVIVTGGDNADHEIQFRLSADQAHDEIIDTVPFTTIPGDCTVVVNPTWISCPGHGSVQVDLGAGNDTVTTGGSQGDCFFVYTFNLGEGTNDNDMSNGCPDAATATINAGSGDDTLRGGSASTSVTIFSGGGADTVNGGDGNDVIHGGDGADGVFGSGGNDQVYGEGGNDRLRGAAGNDIEDGGPGDDDIGYSPGVSHDDDQGGDQLSGGDGTDRLRLSGHSGGMTITLDGQANDGAPGEGDNVGSDIEMIEGTLGNDVFTGSAGADNFLGDSGNDDIHGAGGDDNLSGGGGDDRVFGDGGNDKVQGTNGADTVDGGPGLDQIYGDIAGCSVFCSFDSDTIFARDGERDTVDCGGGADIAHVDGLDVVAFCTSVDRQDVPGQPGPATGPGSALGLKVAGSIRSKALLKRGLAFRLTCPGACKIAAELRYKSKKLGSARKTLLKAGLAKLVVKVSSKARRTVRRLKRGKLTLRLRVTDAAGKTTSLTKTIKFRH